MIIYIYAESRLLENGVLYCSKHVRIAWIVDCVFSVFLSCRFISWEKVNICCICSVIYGKYFELWFSWLCIFKHSLVQVSWSHSISTTKMELVDCTRNYRHVMFYETWSTISRRLIIIFPISAPSAVCLCHYLECCISFHTTLWEFCPFWGHYPECKL